jgi:asparagine synthase (glutamine-hydrolysing)
MCGIAGIYNFDGAPVDPSVLNGMIEFQRHRGPDDSGIRLFSLRQPASIELSRRSEPCSEPFEGGIGFTRLSILDLSERGHQPMANDDGNIFVAFNGEIYNAFSFTKQLQDLGYKFRGNSDTEVVLRLYEQFGLDGLLERINGMFAIAFVDLRDRSITLIRDGTGIKPLLWSIVGKTLLFGSEIKSFLAHPEFECRLTEANLDEYLAFRYCAGDRHLLNGVHQLRPGYLARFSLDRGLTLRRYYQIPDLPNETRSFSGNVLDEFEAYLRASVTSQLQADVRVGCQLSGGIDSSLTTLFANEKNKAINAFSIVFQDPYYSEDRWISQATKNTGVDGHRFIFTADDFFNTLEPATWHLEQPLNHPNTLGLYSLAEKSRPTVKVLLSGEGADELMGGYNRFYYAAVRPIIKPLLPMFSRLPRIGDKFLRNLRPELADETDFFISASMHMQPRELLKVRPGVDFRKLLDARRAIFEEGQGDHLKKCMKYEMQTHLVDLLLRQDRMTMAHSLEGRVPFLDRNLIAFIRSLPSSALVGHQLRVRDRRMHNTKILLKSLARRYFSDQFVFRPKSGFTLPLLEYYLDPRFVSLMEEQILPGMRKRGLVDPEPVRHWWKSIRHVPRIFDETYWVPIMFELWAQQWLEQGRTAYEKPPSHVVDRIVSSRLKDTPRYARGAQSRRLPYNA